MSEQETDRGPLDVAAAEADEVMGEWKKYGRDWESTVRHLGEEATKAQGRWQLALRMQAAFTAEGGQLTLIPDALLKTPKQRAKRRWLMHEDTDGTFRCAKCSHATSRPEGLTDAARKRGIPCPKCNATPEKLEGEQ